MTRVPGAPPGACGRREQCVRHGPGRHRAPGGVRRARRPAPPAVRTGRPGAREVPTPEEIRGQGRFMGDIDPVPHARHAAVVRSPFAHARIGSVDVAAALELPGVLGVLTGADVAALSRPFPAGIENDVPYYAAAVGTARYAGEPVAVVVANSRYLAEDA